MFPVINVDIAKFHELLPNYGLLFCVLVFCRWYKDLCTLPQPLWHIKGLSITMSIYAVVQIQRHLICITIKQGLVFFKQQYFVTDCCSIWLNPNVADCCLLVICRKHILTMISLPSPLPSVVKKFHGFLASTIKMAS